MKYPNHINSAKQTLSNTTKVLEQSIYKIVNNSESLKNVE